MLDLTSRALPNTVLVGGRAFLINTDFRVWVRFYRDIKKGENFNASYIFPEEAPEAVNVYDLMEFAKPQNILPRSMRHSDVIALDYDIDSDLIYAAFLEQYGVDLIEVEHLHWHKFLAMLNGLNEDTKLAKVMGYRCYTKNTDKNRDVYQELRAAWEIEPPQTEEEKADVEELLSAFD